ncbi:MAG: YraN family protein [Planctomycetota bacterium]
MSRRRRRAETGAIGERAAAQFLRRKGYRIEARNLRCQRAEIDILARRGRLWLAAEVKTRNLDPAPELCVEIEQIERLARALRSLATHLRPRPEHLRVDVLAVRLMANETEIRHFPGDCWPWP